MSNPTFCEALTWGSKHLKDMPTALALRQTEELLAHVCSCSRFNLYRSIDKPLSNVKWEKFQEQIRRREEHVPLQHLLGEVDFYGSILEVNADVLIPRLETEELCGHVIDAYQMNPPKRVLDLCTGSGALAIVMAKQWPEAEVWATDVSLAALHMAEHNAKKNGCDTHMHFRLGDLWSAVEGQFDLIVSNPPYIARADIQNLPKEVKDYDPHLALDGGSDGLDFYCRIFSDVHQYLKPLGYLYLEMGETQGDDLCQMAKNKNFLKCKILKDLNKKERFCVLYGFDKN